MHPGDDEPPSHETLLSGDRVDVGMKATCTTPSTDAVTQAAIFVRVTCTRTM